MMSANNNYQARNKFNTLTPAEARKLNKYINHSRPPIRTASVLNKPRPPPIIATNLDSLENNKQQQQNLLHYGRRHLCDEDIQQLSRTNSIRSASVCPTSANRRDRRHSINYGAAIRASTLNSRLSLYSANSNNNSPHQTPQKFSNETKLSSVSKTSLNSSTYKVFQGPIANLKRFFRNSIPKQMTNDGRDTDQGNSANEESTDTSFKSSFSTNMSELSLGSTESLSLFNRSQTPPVCPPPPGELKSMCYMNGSANYSNYDEFTRSRNERPTDGWPYAENPFQRHCALPHQQPLPPPPPAQPCDDTDSWQLTSLPISFERNLATVFEEQKHWQQQYCSNVSNDKTTGLSNHNTGGNLDGLENDIDTTILSETSTLQGDATGASFYMNKCGELERAVTSLKNKLISREKELTDLQLSQLHNDYTIDKLKSQVNKLEKENIQLKNLLSNVNGPSNQPTAIRNTIPKFVRS